MKTPVPIEFSWDFVASRTSNNNHIAPVVHDMAATSKLDVKICKTLGEDINEINVAYPEATLHFKT